MHSGAAETRGLALAALALGGFAVSLLLQVVTWRSLYGDGVAFFVAMLEHRHLPLWPASRIFSTGFFLLPCWLGLQAGITDLGILQALLALGVLAPWPLALWLCWRLAPRHLWLPLAGCGLAYLNSCLLSFSNALAAHAAWWPAAMALVFVRPLDRRAGLTLIGCSLFLLYSYESQLFLGPPLALLALLRLRRSESRFARASLALSALLLLGSAWVALQGLDDPGTSANRDAFLASAWAMLLRPPWTVAFSALLVLLTLAALWQPRLRRAFAAPAGLAAIAVLLLAWGLWPLLAPDLFRPGDQYGARWLNLAVPLLLLPAALLAASREAWFAPRARVLHAGVLCLLLAQSLWQISATVQWQGYLGSLRGLLAARSGPIELGASPLRAPGWPGARYVHDWTLPHLSLLLAPGGAVRSLLWTPGPYLPLDPRNAAALPDLARYGIDLGAYRDALQRRKP